MIEATERATYEEMWGFVPYSEHSPGEQWAGAFAQMSGNTMRGSVLDAGCGGGKGAIALHEWGFAVTMADLTDVGLEEGARQFPFHRIPLWGNLKREFGFVDWVYCADVLEHIPTEWTMLAVSRMLEVARRGCFFSIAFVPDQFGAVIGTPLHQTVQSFSWWKARLNEIGHVTDARDLLECGLFLVESK